MDGVLPTEAGGDHAVTGMATTMDIVMDIRKATVPDIMQADVPLTDGQHLMPTGQGPLTMYITIVLRGSEEPVIITMMPELEID